MPGRELEQSVRWYEWRDALNAELSARYGGYLASQMRSRHDEMVTLYRGATPLTAHGVYWTKNRGEAEVYARRCVSDGWDGALFMCEIPMSGLFALKRRIAWVRPEVLEQVGVVELERYAADEAEPPIIHTLYRR
ncbi:hypothetical protein CJ197_07250 [Brachybacterium sp. UMB0905]|nr:hypothetical protein CJ197_07250 [Brachybacterium sp. UMB0905]